MHNPRAVPVRGLSYIIDANPGRHMVSIGALRMESEGSVSDYPELKAIEDKDEYQKRAKTQALIGGYNQTYGDSGMCLFALFGCNIPVVEFINLVTGWDFTVTEAVTVGRRTLALRQAFNIREGLSPKDFVLPPRMTEPATAGPFVGQRFDFNRLRTSYYKAMGWDTETGCPSEQCLTELGLKELVGTPP